MGMAHRILGAGHDLVVFDAVAAQTEPFVKGGARAAASLADVCAGREVVVSMLVEDSIVLDVVTGTGGLRDSLSKGAIHLVMGTHGVATIRALEEAHTAAGQILVASPCSAGPSWPPPGSWASCRAAPRPPWSDACRCSR